MSDLRGKQTCTCPAGGGGKEERSFPVSIWEIKSGVLFLPQSTHFHSLLCSQPPFLFERGSLPRWKIRPVASGLELWSGSLLLLLPWSSSSPPRDSSSQVFIPPFFYSCEQCAKPSTYAGSVASFSLLRPPFFPFGFRCVGVVFSKEQLPRPTGGLPVGAFPGAGGGGGPLAVCSRSCGSR